MKDTHIELNEQLFPKHMVFQFSPLKKQQHHFFNVFYLKLQNREHTWAAVTEESTVIKTRHKGITICYIEEPQKTYRLRMVGYKDDVRGDVLRPPHDTTPTSVKINTLGIVRSFGSKEYEG